MKWRMAIRGWRSIALCVALVLIAVGSLVGVRLFSGGNAASCKQLYIPPPYLSSDWADLDLRTALAFILPDGCFGCVYFTAANEARAEYVMVVLKREGSAIRRIATTEKGILRYGLKGAKIPGTTYFKISEFRHVKCGQVSMIWTPPMNLHLIGGVESIALIPLADIRLIEEGATNKIQWTAVFIPQM